MAKKNRIKADYFIHLSYTEKDVEKSTIIKLLSVVVSKRGYKPRKKDKVDEVARVELKDMYTLSIMLNELIRDLGFNVYVNGEVNLYLNDKGELDLRREDHYVHTSLIHFETDLELKTIEKFLEDCRGSIIESIVVNIPPIVTDSVLIYKGNPDDNLLPLGQTPRSLDIKIDRCLYL